MTAPLPGPEGPGASIAGGASLVESANVRSLARSADLILFSVGGNDLSHSLSAAGAPTEALTNVTRHAGDATATVRVSYGERELSLQIDDDGRGPATAEVGSSYGSDTPVKPWISPARARR